MRHLIASWLVLLVGIASVSAQEKTAADKNAKSKPNAAAAQSTARPDAIPGYVIKQFEGFTCVISDETVKNQESSTLERKPYDVLDLELKTVATLLSPEAVKLLRGLLIWVEWDVREAMSNGREGSAAAVYYGGHQMQLLSKGLHPLKAKNITILSMKGLTAEHQPKRDSGRCVILHEMTHAVHDQFFGNDNEMIKAGYRQAMEKKLYDPSMYAATNEHEYFAELTCAYFDQLHYHPRTRSALQKHDPLTYQMLEGVWGKRKTTPDDKLKPTASDTIQLTLDQVDLGSPVSGPTLSREQLKDHAVLVLLWNSGNTSSLASFQKLNAWNDELEDFGLITIAVHLTGQQSADVKQVAASRNVSFSVTEGRWVGGGLVANFNDFPLCLVFDQRGQCTYKGTPFEAEPALRSAVGSALVAGSGVETFPKALSATVESLQKGKSPAQAFTQLAGSSRSSDAETADAAKKLMVKMTEVAQKVLEQAETTSKDDPVGTYLRVERYPFVYKNTPVATKATVLLTRLKKDKAVVTELKAQPAMVQIRKLDGELSSRPGSFNPKLDEFRKENAQLIQQLREGLNLVKSSWPTSLAAKEASAIAERYGF